MKRLFIFDWGNTIMRDFPGQPGPMCDWPLVEWVDGAERALQFLVQNHALAIATNAGCSDTSAMRLALKRVDAEKYFSWFFSSKDLGIRKPDPLFFTTIARQCGYPVGRCVMVGDSYENDIAGAARAGMTTVWLSAAESDSPAAMHRISSMHHLIQLF